MPDTAEMIAVMEAYERGEPIEGRGAVSRQWAVVRNPTWNWAVNVYRVQPKPELIPDTINWDHVADWVQCIARDGNEIGFGYEEEPMKFPSGWAPRGRYVSLGALASYQRGTVPWDQSLIRRPTKC